MEIEEVRKKLRELENKEYAEFNKKLCPDTSKNIAGIKIPQLRSLAKQIAKDENWQNLIQYLEETSLEETILKGFIIAYSNVNIEEKLNLTKKFIPSMDSWVMTDTFCPTLKIKEKDLHVVWDFILPYANSNKEFETRFCIIMMLDYYINEEYVDKVIKIIDEIKNDAYYVQMAKAWVIAEIGIKFNNKAIEYLTGKNNLDKFTYNKALQKMIESYRISNEQKIILRNMKRKS